MVLAHTTRIGIASPHIFPDGIVDTVLVQRYVQRAEALGYASLWTQERVTGRPTVLDPTTFLTYISAFTSKARLGVSVYVLPRHNPIMLAKQLASLDQLSGGRLILGVGLGANGSDLLQYGVDPERRVRRFIEQVQAIRALWTQSPAKFSGEFVEFDGANIEPKPAQKPHPPIWFGANVEAAVRRAVRYADGWTGAGSSGREMFDGNLKLVHQVLADEGRDRASFPISKRVYMAIEDDEARALERLREWSAYYYGNPDVMDRGAVYGSKQRVLEQLEKWSEAGVDEFVLNPVYDMEEHLELIAEMTGLS